MPTMEQVRPLNPVSDTAPLFDGEVLLNGPAVAKSLGMSPRQFRRLVEAGDGPPYLKFGKKIKRYRPSVVAGWAMAHVEITAPAITKPEPKSQSP
jgi:hypothetical protein